MTELNRILLIFTLAISITASERFPRNAQNLSVSNRALFSTETPGIRHLSAQQLQSSDTHRIYLPQVLNPDLLWYDQPIWANSEIYARHEVALFRRIFNPDTRVDDAELHIFADTRYQVWLDGQWIGRGPARFSRNLHEYDVIRLGSLPLGEHLLAVQVQWAPNTRRFESSVPHLVGHIEGNISGIRSSIASTSEQWKALISPAWRQDAAPVHAWQLIGPTELLDLRLLPKDWNQPAFDDKDWSYAAAVNLMAAQETMGAQESAGTSIDFTYQPRSIDPLEYNLVTPKVFDAGLLSPGFRIGEIFPPSQDPYTIPFTQTVPGPFILETLLGSGLPTSTIRLDNELFQWQPAPNRPDVITTIRELASGTHTLSFEEIPDSGITFAVSALNSRFPDFPFSQGTHAGRRMLLSNPVSQPEAVAISKSPGTGIRASVLPAYLVLDLGKIVHGRLYAQVSGSTGSVIDIGWDERLYGEGKRPLPYPGSSHPEWNQVDSWILDGSERTISTIDTRAGRYILITIWGDGEIRLSSIRVLEERYPITRSGSFHSSDPRLDRIWQVGLDTLIPNRTDGYTDTPWRERGQWWGDVYIAEHINRVSFGDLRLLKRGLHLMASSFDETGAPGIAPNSNNTHMLDYAMLWVASLSEYIQLKDDRPFLRETYPTVQKFIQHLSTFENSETGLLDLPVDHWSRFAFIDGLGYSSRYGQSTAVNASYYHTLQAAAYLADTQGDHATAQAWHQRAEVVRQQIYKLLFIEEEHRFVTTFFQGEVVSPTPHAQAWPLAYGLYPEDIPGETVASLIELLSPNPEEPNVSIYGMYWVLEALGRTGHVDEGLELINRYYGHMLDAGAGNWWEGFNADESATSSYSHVWGGAPTWFLTTYILGAKWTGPAAWKVSPAFTGVTSASGSIPIDDGLLKVGWQRSSCGRAILMIQSARSTSGEVIVPIEWPLFSVSTGEQTIWQTGAPNSDAIFLSSDGLHLIHPGGSLSLVINYQC